MKANASCGLVVVSVLGAIGTPGCAQALQPFSSLATGDDTGAWQPITLRNEQPASFEIVADAGKTALQITATRAVGALAHPVAASDAFPASLTWRWKIANHIDKSDISSKAGDDFPARVYVTFARDPEELPWGTRVKMRVAKLLYGHDIPAASLCYVWARDLPVGLIMPNAYTDTVMMVVVRSGGQTPSAWEFEQRDVMADYRRAFGTAAPAVTSVMVAADTDNTGERVTSWFGDISFTALPFSHGEEELQRPLETKAIQ